MTYAIGTHAGTTDMTQLNNRDRASIRALNAGHWIQEGTDLVMYDTNGCLIAVRPGLVNGRQRGPEAEADAPLFDLCELQDDPGLGGPDGWTAEEAWEHVQAHRFWRGKE